VKDALEDAYWWGERAAEVLANDDEEAGHRVRQRMAGLVSVLARQWRRTCWPHRAALAHFFLETPASWAAAPDVLRATR
jgi:hypothetical protein